MKTTLSALVLSLALAVPGLVAAAPTGPAPGRVDGATAKALVGAGAKLVDVRMPDEFASGHVPGAVNIPLHELTSRLAEVGPTSTKVVVYCRSGSRSASALKSLQRAGYANVYDMGPATAWPGKLVR
ncbi:MAG TPA: rhodanese-like domain-containing protein [Anaeromyxobacteraceae bacterium]|nr:rhodanese-like domain-containing protein [Anaeromyxobacteraceae bacterium]